MLIDFAIQKIIPPGPNDPRIKPRMGILHVDGGNAFSLFKFFNGPSKGVEAHGHIRKDGKLEQYRDTAFEADANLHANPFALSFESQGFADEEWNSFQLATIKHVIGWCHVHHKIPFRVVTSWDDPKGGWGYHTMWGAPSQWTPVVKSCPGPKRIEQFHDVLVPWMKDMEDDVFDKADSDRLKRVEVAVNTLARRFDHFRANEVKRDASLRVLLKAQFNATDKQLDEIFAELQ